MASAAVTAAKARRAGRAGQAAVEEQWFINEVAKRIDLTFEQRMRVAVDFLRNKIVKNISVPVVKQVINGKTRVTERSKPGEFPRADTTQLMKSIFSDVVQEQPGVWNGYVGTPISYGLILELTMDRRFLTRTLNEELENLRKILSGPIV